MPADWLTTYASLAGLLLVLAALLDFGSGPGGSAA